MDRHAEQDYFDRPRSRPELAYAVPRRHKRSWLGPAALAVGAIAAWYLILAAGRPAWQRAVRQFQIVSLWNHCNAAIAPSQEIEWEENPEDGDLLLADAAHYDTAPFNFQPAVMRKTPAERTRLLHMLGRFDPPAGPTLFMHERTNPGSDAWKPQRQLVNTDLLATPGNRRAANRWTFITCCVRPSALGEFQIINSVVTVEIPQWIGATRHYVRFYAGQPDALDTSHFEIGYAVDGDQGVIDGWLQDGSRTVLRIRDGPALDPSADPSASGGAGPAP